MIFKKCFYEWNTSKKIVRIIRIIFYAYKNIPEWIYIENFLKFIYFKWGFSF